MPRKAPEPAKEILEPVEPLLWQPFRAHCNQRHRLTMRMVTKGEHAADHRLHADVIDHTHSPFSATKETAKEPESDPTD